MISTGGKTCCGGVVGDRSSAWGKFKAVDAPVGKLFAGTKRSVFQGALGGDNNRFDGG
jgi:hypothetical protein